MKTKKGASAPFLVIAAQFGNLLLLWIIKNG